MAFRPNGTEQQLLLSILDPKVANDPLAFVQLIFPWGKPNTPLEKHKGPRKWQERILKQMRSHIWDCEAKNLMQQPMDVFRVAVASGRGIGKSALVSWLILWFVSTRIGGTCMVSANNEAQLKSVTWGELGKWHAMAANKHWFELSATSLQPAKHFKSEVQEGLKRGTEYYYAQAKLWSEENPDAYAGVHNPLGVMLIFDEGSGIPHPIWTVAEGFFTEPIVDRYWFSFSNPRRNTGAFFECFHANRDFWNTHQIDSRDVEGTDKAVYRKIIAQYGEDSDEAKVEVKGQFPSQGDKQFISREVIKQAQERELIDDPGAPLIMGVDVARFGADTSVIRFRRGRDARSYPVKRFKGMDNMQLAYRCAELIDKMNPDAVCIDAGGGTGVIDRLRDLGYKVHEVWFGANSEEAEYKNKRTMMWGRMRDWLTTGCIDDSKELADDLAGPEYLFYQNSDVKILESKESMKKRGLHSPDEADALCLVAGTMIRTTNGLVPIERIIPGDVVITPFGNSEVAIVWESKTESITSVRFSNGAELSGKGEHKVFAWGDGSVRLDALSMYNEIETFSHWRLMVWRLASLLCTEARNIGFKAAVDTFSRETKLTPSGFFIAGFGMTITAIYRMAMKFITKMAIGVTTPLRTLRFALPVNISESTCLSGASQNRTSGEATYGRQETRLPSGTGLMMEGCGTRSTGSASGKEGSNLTLPVVDAESSSNHSSRQEQNIAQSLAHKQQDFQTTSLTRRIACVVGRSLHRIGIGTQNTVPVTVQTSIVSPTKTYNLTLSEHNVYYANDVLVFNCCTFAIKVARNDLKASRHRRNLRQASDLDYNVFT